MRYKKKIVSDVPFASPHQRHGGFYVWNINSFVVKTTKGTNEVVMRTADGTETTIEAHSAYSEGRRIFYGAKSSVDEKEWAKVLCSAATLSQ